MEPSQDERRIMELPANHEVVDGALRLIVALARETVGAADGVSVSLRRNGVLSTVAASDRTISSMDADQYATGEGPCVDASIQGRWYHAESMSAETRWPDFTPRALELGINSILSTPLMAQANPVGALNIYSRTELAFSPADQEMAALFADQASEILTNAGAQVTDDESAARFAEALSSRETIAQAQGILMERMGVSMTAAFSMLLHSSVVSRETLREEAEAVVRSVLRIWPDNTGSPHDRHDQ
jgi:GAF domain-containing protein